MTSKTVSYVLLLSVLLNLCGAVLSIASRPPKFGFRIGTGLLWAPEDKENLAGERLYRQHYPFHMELSYGGQLRGVLGLNHFFSQEKEHVEGDSAKFTPKLRQYAIQLGVQAQRDLIAGLRVYGGLGGTLLWRSYNPGWKNKSYWDKTRAGASGQVGVELKLGPKAWVGLGWRYYAISWSRETRWTRGEFNRMRRMSILSVMVSYSPKRW
jgi:hypothetical protein